MTIGFSTMSPAFQQAVQLLGEQPLPADAEERLAALEAQIEPQEEEAFGDLWEAFLVAQEPPVPA